MEKESLDDGLVEIEIPLSDTLFIYHALTGKERPTMYVSEKELKKAIRNTLIIYMMFPLSMLAFDLMETKSITETYKRFANGAYTAVALEMGPRFELPYETKRP